MSAKRLLNFLRKGYHTTIPSGVWVLGVASLCMDLSSEAIHSLLPVFLVSVLGASTVFVGLIEGVILQPFSTSLPISIH